MSKSELQVLPDNFFDRLTEVIATQNEAVLGKVGELSQTVEKFDGRLKYVESNLNYIKLERPIDRRCAAQIRRTVSRRVCELLEVPVRKKDRTIEDCIKYKKYARKLFGCCYTEVPGEGHLARSSYLDTPIRYFDDAIRDIESFVPMRGMPEFYAEVDREALATKIVKEQGYE